MGCRAAGWLCVQQRQFELFRFQIRVKLSRRFEVRTTENCTGDKGNASAAAAHTDHGNQLKIIDENNIVHRYSTELDFYFSQFFLSFSSMGTFSEKKNRIVVFAFSRSMIPKLSSIWCVVCHFCPLQRDLWLQKRTWSTEFVLFSFSSDVYHYDNDEGTPKHLSRTKDICASLVQGTLRFRFVCGERCETLCHRRKK